MKTSGKRVSVSQRGFVTTQSNQATVRKPWKSLAAVAFGLLLSAPGLMQAQYIFTTIDVPNTPGQTVTATAANGNSTNKIVGQFFVNQGPPHGFVLNNDDGVFTTIDAPLGANGTGINGVNEFDQLAGTYLDSAKVFHAFFENINGSNFTTIDPPNSIQTASGFLNAQGPQVVGTYRTRNPHNQIVTRHGFIWLNGTFTTFNVPGDDPGFGTRAFGINDQGEVVGDYKANKEQDGTPGLRHGYLRSSNGIFTTFTVPHADLTTGEGINNDGTIVGFYILNNVTHGFVLNDGVFLTVDVPDSKGNAQHTEIYSINATGEIVGAYYENNDMKLAHSHGFRGVPASAVKTDVPLEPFGR
jgi:uncharacterized membrane protein